MLAETDENAGHVDSTCIPWLEWLETLSQYTDLEFGKVRAYVGQRCLSAQYDANQTSINLFYMNIWSFLLFVGSRSLRCWFFWCFGSLFRLFLACCLICCCFLGCLQSCNPGFFCLFLFLFLLPILLGCLITQENFLQNLFVFF